jgi:hypothetical protein
MPLLNLRRLCENLFAGSSMSFTTSDFQGHVDDLLREFGYEIGGDDEIGWTFHFGGDDSAHRGPQVDSAAQACLSALNDLIIGTQDLMSAAKAVLENWESGDLAAAVRELATCVRVLDPDDRCHQPVPRLDERLAQRLLRLVRDGLEFSTCVRLFGVDAERHPIARTARRNYQREGELEIDDYTVVTRADDSGAYVLSWLRIATESAPHP